MQVFWYKLFVLWTWTKTLSSWKIKTSCNILQIFSSWQYVFCLIFLCIYASCTLMTESILEYPLVLSETAEKNCVAIKNNMSLIYVVVSAHWKGAFGSIGSIHHLWQYIGNKCLRIVNLLSLEYLLCRSLLNNFKYYALKSLQAENVNLCTWHKYSTLFLLVSHLSFWSSSWARQHMAFRKNEVVVFKSPGEKL